jgi:hypothetical protein
MDLENCLLTVNDWWMRVPTVNRYLHWDDHKQWPSAWELLADNLFCDLARAAGIVYTLQMLDLESTHRIEIAQTDDANLVLVDAGKYILNWCPGQLLNIATKNITTRRLLKSQAIRHTVG